MDARRLAIALCFLGAPLAAPTLVAAQQGQQFRIDIPAGNLSNSINVLAHQTGASIGGAQPGMRNTRTPAVKGRMSLEAALRQLLRNTPYTFRRVSGNAFQIIPRPRTLVSEPQDPSPNDAPPGAIPNGVQPSVGPPIIVIASKRDAELRTYPGSASVIDLAEASPARLFGGVEDLAASLPAFTTTNLGPGRNKIFIRGFADSSFNGPSQSTTALYLDEYRLVYSAPNPDLRAVDLQSVELLEGPQGTLYGAGAIGGTLRIQQNGPDASDPSATVNADFTAVEGGGSAGSLSGTLNLPVGDTGALRVVGYRQVLPGYIDDVERDLRNVNRSTIAGWRASFATSVLTDWDIRFDALQQDLDTEDGQYSEPSVGRYARRSAIAQPFSSDVFLAGLTVSRSWDRIELVSATNWTKSDLESRFDLGAVSAEGIPQLFEELRAVELLNHETRISGSNDRFRWLMGVSAIQNVDRRIQLTGSEDDLAVLEELKFATTEIASFGEINGELVDRLDLTLGLRLVNSWIVTELAVGDDGEIDPRRQEFRVMPTVALGYRLDDDWYAYARYQEGFRSGGTSIAGDSVDDREIENFDADEVGFFEAGIRGALPALGVTNISLSLSYAQWEDIQSDIIDADGFPFTTNVGTGDIYSANVALTARPWQGFEIETRAFLSSSDTVPKDGGILAEEGEFPNIPELGFTVTARQTLFEVDQSRLRIGTDYTLVGESMLALQPDLEIDQGDLSLASAWVDYRFGRNQLSLAVRNLFDASGNRFSFGNPFTVFDEAQATPLQPRTISIAFSRRF